MPSGGEYVNNSGLQMPNPDHNNHRKGDGYSAGHEYSDPRIFQSWVIGVLNGGQQDWLQKYAESEFYSIARQELRKRTGLDVQWLVNGYTVARAGRKYIPWAFQKVKDRTTSSVTVDENTDNILFSQILQVAARQTESTSTGWLKSQGQHDELGYDDTYQASSKTSSRFLWHEGTLIVLEIIGPSKDGNSASHGDRALTLRCFGHSNIPVQKFITHCRNLQTATTTLHLLEWTSEGCVSKERSKRPLASIDLDPAVADDIRRDAERYFDHSSQDFYAATGNPYRRGYLLTGPPGTGKTSLSVALASHFEIPLVTIHLSGMDDKDVEEAFSALPFRCVALLEDIDCAGVCRQDTTGEDYDNANGTAVDAAQLEEFRNSLSTASPEELIKQLQEGTLVVPKRQKRITLSGLLNAIDGASSQEGRLLIMTTNAPRSLDGALYRPGRIDKIIEMGFSTKISSEVCFKRMFSRDPCKSFSDEAIARFAKAFRDQFPNKSKITPAELSKYCLNYRGEPVKAVQEFGAFLHKRRTGDDGFTYDINDKISTVEEDEDQQESFDPELLQLTSGDILSGGKCTVDIIPNATAPARKSWWSFIGHSQPSPDTHLQALEVGFGKTRSTPLSTMSMQSKVTESQAPASPPGGAVTPRSSSGNNSPAAVTVRSNELNVQSRAQGETTTKKERRIQAYWQSYDFIKPRCTLNSELEIKAQAFDFDDESLYPEEV